MTYLQNLDGSGVYGIYCDVGGRVYIGSGVDLKRRKTDHWSRLVMGTHPNTHLQAAWNRYGPEVFSFVVLERVDDPERLIEREQYWIDLHRSYDHAYGFNNRPDARSNLGMRHSEGTRERMSRSHQARGTRPPPVSEEQRERLRQLNRGKTASDATRAKLDALARRRKSEGRYGPRRWVVTSPDGVETAISNLSQFCKSHGLSYEGMARVAYGRERSHHGWRCRRDDSDEA